MATRVFDGIKFCEQFLKRISQGTFLPSLVQIGTAVLEEKVFKEIDDDARRTKDDAGRTMYNGRCRTDDRHWTTLKAPLGHVVLR